MESAIKTNNLSKKFGDVRAVSGLDLDIKKGEVFGFLGPNGAGKTTTIRMILNFIFPSSGKISVFGKNPASESAEIMRDSGYIAGDISLYENYRVNDFLNYVEDLRGRRSNKKTELLDRFDLNPRRKIRQLSKGNKQKVAIVQAFMHSPQLLVLDEPTSGLDPLLQLEFFKLIEEMQKQGSTIFFSSHILSEVQRVCDRVGIIKKGKLIALETIRDLSSKNVYLVELIAKKEISKGQLNKLKYSNFKSTGQLVSFNYTGDVNRLVKILSSLELVHVNIKEPNLEELFLTYYKD